MVLFEEKYFAEKNALCFIFSIIVFILCSYLFYITILGVHERIFFSAVIEIDRAFSDKVDLQPSKVLETLQSFYRKVDEEGMESPDPAVSTYYKAAVQASNDKGNRIRRGEIIHDLLRGIQPVARLI